jgi:uncharacterized protein CbrC (UPF0167 family)
MRGGGSELSGDLQPERFQGHAIIRVYANEFETFLQALTPDGGATAYLFRCRHCHPHLAYADFV